MMMWKRVIVGIDFSAISVAAARWVAEAFAPDAERILVHAVELPEPPEFLRKRLPDHAAELETQRRGAEIRMGELTSALGGEARTLVRPGRPALVLADAAREQQAELIVAGEHGRRKGIAGILGSTAEELIHISPVPLLMLRVVPVGDIQTLLVPVADTPCGEKSLALASQIAQERNVHVVLFHALSPGMVGRVGLISTDRAAAEFERGMVTETREWLEKQAVRHGLPADRTTVHVTFGAPGYEILAALERLDNPMVVMGSRCPGTVSRVLLGSVARTVAHTAACPILLVREN